MGEALTPMMEQYHKIKNQYKDCMLFFRLGDFYEMFLEDAVEGSKILGIVLTARNKGISPVPMCGIPYHAAESYIAKLIQAGKKIAICEQVSDPNEPGIVDREVIRVITPGTNINENILDKKTNQYIAALYPKESYFGLAYADITTGEFQLTEVSGYKNFVSELKRIDPKECILKKEILDDPNIKKFFEGEEKIHVYPFETWDDPYKTLINHFQTKTLEGFGVEKYPFGIQAAGMLLSYLKETQKTNLSHIQKITVYERDNFMNLDEATIQNLELLQTMREKNREGSVLSILDKTVTSMGGRLLKKWIIHPLIVDEEINKRLFALEELKNNEIILNSIRELLKEVLDIERIIGRIGLNVVNARDIFGLSMSLKNLPKIKKELEKFKSEFLINANKQIENCDDIVENIEQAINNDPPFSLREGGIIKDGYSAELDKLRKISFEGKDYIKNLQSEEIIRTKINSLKVGYNRVFGYYIEISKTNLHLVPLNYIRKQTLANCERFITPELKEYENTVLGAEEKIQALEYELFCNLRDEISLQISRLQKVSLGLALVDVISNFAHIAIRYNYTKPEILKENILYIKNGRHPVMEQMAFNNEFVSNDVEIDKNKKLILVTGPNMGGKSTFLRQTALITLFAHIGSFVSADSAKIGLCDRIFTRVGASDSLIKGQSTFMVEMYEAANILNNATARSLIILDEIGRGTSTYDGVSIAWAIAEYLHDKIKAKTLFATHYHELIPVIEKLEYAENYSVAVRENREGVIFLYKVIKGGIDKSYGIEVARLAGLPREIIEKSKQILVDLEERVVEKGIKDRLANPKHKISEAQMDIFSANQKSHPALEALKGIDVDKITPLEAIKKLYELKHL